jgi:amino acid adenylation domain-containing protein/non-ribosomal peptide synthase protein (TIGR01720 family)
MRPAASLVNLLQERAVRQPRQVLYRFLENGETEAERLSISALDSQARAIGATLQKHCGRGDRALLLYPPGLDFIPAFFGCLYAGVAAVPAYPPSPSGAQTRLSAIVRDSGARAVLTTSALHAQKERLVSSIPELRSALWIETDRLETGLLPTWNPAPAGEDEVAFLQYTSGSTADPKGVMITHRNLLENEARIQHAFGQSESSVIVGWLPLYHDMGLIGNVLQPLYLGARCVLMSPLAFLQRPYRWLKAISDYRATTSGGPSFAYELCLRKVPPEQRRGLDLSSWTVAFNGAEPIRPETLERFAEELGPQGFRATAFYPCYGLAEATLLVSGAKRGEQTSIASVDGAALERNQVLPAPVTAAGARRVVGCGQGADGQRLLIVDPETGEPCAPDRVGEIRVAGPSVAAGYWGRPEAEAFQVTGDGERFLRTGDLGFLRDGELFVTGRLKDLLILRGRNLYPQDLELTAERSHPALRPGSGAAFSIDVEGEERLVVVQEVERRAQRRLDAAEADAAIRRALAEEHQVQPHDVVLAPAGTVPRTSSGKVRRQSCRAAYLAGELARLDAPRSAESLATAPTPEELRTGTWEERRARILAYLRAEVARLARLPLAAIAATAAITDDRPLIACGLDSLAAIEVKAALEDRLGLTISLSRLLEGATLADLAGEVLSAPPSTPGADANIAGQAGQEDGEHPLSHGQSALWYLHRLAPGSPVYNIVGAAAVDAELDLDALGRALAVLADRHPALRTTFHDTHAGPRQRLGAGLPPSLTNEDASRLSPEELAERLCEEAYRPFDLAAGPLLRLHVISRSVVEHVLVLAVHHIVSDFWSLAILLRELGALYAQETTGRPARLAAPAYLYSAHVAAERERLAGPRGEALRLYWQTRMPQDPPVLDLPLDRPRPAEQSFRGAACRWRLDRDAAAALGRLAAAHRSTLYTALLSVYEALLHRYSGQDEVVVGSPVAGRSSTRDASVVGYFVNTVLLDGNLAGEPTFAAWLEEVRDTVVQALDHWEFPLPLLAERLRPERDPARSPLCQAFFTLHRTPAFLDPGLAACALGEPGRPLDLGGLALRSVAIEERRAPFELALSAAELDGGIALVAQYATDLWDRGSIERLLGHFEALLLGACATPSEPVSRLPLLRPAEREQLLGEWATAARAFPEAGLCVHDLVERQAALRPDRCAVDDGRRQLSYGELDARANRLGRLLQGQGVSPEALVGVYAERSPELVVALLAVLKAGGACLPLDPTLPAERLAHIAATSGISAILVQDGLPPLPVPDGVRTILLGEETGQDGLAPGADVQPDHPAYVTFTSGSTGRPKGVINTHRGFVNLLLWAREAYALTGDDRILQSTPLSFDFALWEIFAPLSAGARLVLTPPGGSLDPGSLRALMVDQGVTTVHFVPSMLRAFLAEPDLEGLGSLRLVLCGGEALPTELAHRLLARVPADLHHLYGPTEAAINALHQRLRPGDEVLLGEPLANLRCVLLDRRQEPVPLGVPGEICLGGPGLARGYLGRPDLTAERFIPDPLSTHPGERLYRTGDLARRLPQGALSYLGRVDHQIKIRGVRVEPAEVEAALAAHPGVREAVVIAREITREKDGRGKQLVAYVVPAPGTRPDGGELQAHLQATLPPAMIPALFVLLERLPLTPSGKVDRKALPSPEAARSDQQAPRTAVELQLAEIWSQVLGRQPIGIHDNFFQLGGDSILSLQVAARARSQGLDLTAGLLLKHQTIAALAPRVRLLDLEPDRPPRPEPLLLPADLESLREDPGVEDLYPLSPMQLSMLARSLQTGEYVNQLGWRVRGELAAGRFAEAWQETVQRHAALRVACLWEGLEEPVQVVHRRCELPWTTLDWRDVPAVELENRLTAFTDDDRRRGFELSQPPLMRFTLIRSGEREHRLLWTHHHLLLDGWSLALVLEEVLTRYHDREPRAWEAPPAHRDFIAWLRSRDLSEAEAFWRQEMSGFQGSTLSDSTDSEPSPPGREEIHLSAEETADLRSLAMAHRLPLSTLVYGAWALLLGRSHGIEDVAFGMVVAGRSAALPGVESLVGLLINTLPLRLRLPPDLPLPDWWAQVQERQAELTLREHTPLAAIERWGGLPRGRVLFDSIAAFENYPVIRLAEGTIELDDLRVIDPTSFPLALAATPGPSLALALSFDRRRIQPAEASQRLRQLRAVLQGFAQQPEARLGELSSLTGVERLQAVRTPDRQAQAVSPAGPIDLALERRIGALWAEALGLDAVGRDDNFFELGGDSILSLQIASRASREGLRIPPRKIFEHPTVAALARALAGLQPADAGLEADPGPLPLTPIQRRFFEQPPADAHHWNQALVLDALEPLDSGLLRQACGCLLRRHDALRLRFACEDGIWRQRVSAPPEEIPVHLIDLGALPAALHEQACADASAALQASLDLGQGPLLRIAGFCLAEGLTSRLLWIVHHLAVDTVSWRVLIEDLEAAYRQLSRGESARLPAPGISFRGWADRLCRQGPEKVAAALDSWLEKRQVSRLPLDLPGGANTEASARAVTVRLTAEETHGLIRDLPRLDRIQPQEALLAALLAAVRPWTGESRLLLDLEGHGREDLWEEIDLSRTVGWFTSVFPVLLELEEEAPLDRRAVQAVGRQLRAVPDRGVSYGVLRYLSDHGATLISQPEVSFNYLGQLDAALAGGSLLRPRAEAPPALRSPRGLRRHLLEVDAWVAGGRLQADFTYSGNLHRRATIEAVADGFAASLRALLAGRDMPPVDLIQSGMAPAGLISRQEMENAFGEVEL